MAKIIQDEKQKQMLREVNSSISGIKDLNAVLSAGSLQISTLKQDGEKAAAVVISEDEDHEAYEKITAALLKHKALKAREIRKTAAVNRLELSEEDNAVLS